MSLLLPHGCRTGKISVSPKNWEDSDADTGVDWFIHYRFHDPNFQSKYPKGFLVQVRGMNASKGLMARRRDTRGLIDDEIKHLEEGYNPILKRTVSVELNELEIPPTCPFMIALQRAYGMLPENKTTAEIRKALVHIKVALKQLGYENIKISDIRRRHIKALLAKIGQNKKETTGKEWGAPSYNHYRSYLDILFNQLDEAEATEMDPVSKVKKKRITKTIRVILTAGEVDVLNEKVQAQQYTLWRFIHIFFHSGARMAELMLVKRKDVDLPGQRFMVIVRKGSGDIEQVWKTITLAALPLWTEVMQEGKLQTVGQRGFSGRTPCCLLQLPNNPHSPNDFLFSYELRVGSRPINEHQVTKRWRIHVKKKLGIEADFYSLKHKNTTEIVSSVLRKLDQATQAAAERNSHKDNTMVSKRYDVERNAREHAELRDLDIRLN